MENDDKKASALKRYIVLFCAEFFGTAILMYIGCLGTVLVRYVVLQPLIIASTFGLAIAASVQTFGHISGSHINPGVSLGAFILNKLTWKKLLVYWAGQYTGAFFGYGLLWVQISPSSRLLEPCALAVSDSLGIAKVFFLEFTTSAILFLAVGGATDNANKGNEDSISVRLGFIIYGMVVAIGELSGAGLNSARALPSAVFNSQYKGHWVYHLGPVLGQCVGALIYKFLFDTTDRFSLNRQGSTNNTEEP